MLPKQKRMGYLLLKERLYIRENGPLYLWESGQNVPLYLLFLAVWERQWRINLYTCHQNGRSLRAKQGTVPVFLDEGDFSLTLAR